MCGMFESTDGEENKINNPSPYLCDSKDKAMKARNLGYRFVMLDENIGPQIVIYENENLKVQNNNGKKDLKVWVDGKKVELYDFNKFKEQVKKLGYEQVRDLAEFAIQNKLADFEKCEFIKEICGKDIIQAIRLSSKNKEE